LNHFHFLLLYVMCQKLRFISLNIKSKPIFCSFFL
jgi:hypothetical protein